MKARTVQVVLDLNKNINTLNEVIGLRQGENKSTTIEATVLCDSQYFDLSGAEAELHIGRSDRTIITQPVTVENNKLVCTLDKDATAVAGKAVGIFVFTSDDLIFMTGKFTMNILRAMNPTKKKQENEPQPIDLHTLSNNNERKAQWVK